MRSLFHRWVLRQERAATDYSIKRFKITNNFEQRIAPVNLSIIILRAQKKKERATTVTFASFDPLVLPCLVVAYIFINYSIHL